MTCEKIMTYIGSNASVHVNFWMHIFVFLVGDIKIGFVAEWLLFQDLGRAECCV